ncbi:DUF427 domain-containing protein [Nocardioides sambongensis]|uniref:DUF427 domain-containing protein n=1 Tax=Nocardioides sambongensis TaxID=2589074 RepID=UPI0038B31808
MRYFPRGTVLWSALSPSDVTSQVLGCGRLHYYDINLPGMLIPAGACSYLRPMPRVALLAGRVAFAPPVVVTAEPIERNARTWLR